LTNICGRFSSKPVITCSNKVIIQLHDRANSDKWSIDIKSSNNTITTVHSFNCNRQPLLPPSLRCNTIGQSEVRTSYQSQQRIVGGNTAERYSWPWIVHFDRVGCGGTIISQNWVVTAAHCCVGQTPSRMRFIVNEHNQFANEGREKVHSASEVIIYPFYDELTVENDICLIYTDDPIEYGYGAEQICLPDDNYEIVDGEECYTAGWGKSSYNGAVNLELTEVGLPIIDSKTCYEWYSRIGIRINSMVMICAGYENGYRDSCLGDSGGPLICIRDGQPVLTGITSWGVRCAEPLKPGVYTRFSEYKKWIMEQIGDDVDIGIANARNDTEIFPGSTPEDNSSSTSAGVGLLPSFVLLEVLFLLMS